VLVVGPSTSQGGIASVIRIHQLLPLWKRAHCRILPTFDERGTWKKLIAMLKAYAVAPFLIWRSSIIHIHLAAQHSMWRKLPIALIAKLLRKPYIIHLHAASERSVFILTPQWIVRTLFLLSYRVVVLSESWAAVVKKHLPDARVTVVHNPVMDPQTAPSARGSGQTILFAGKLERRKGYMELLKAASEVLRCYANVKFCFAGHGEVQQARVEAERLGIMGSVSFPGWVRPEEMSDYYREATIFCLPSFDEGLPMSILEAMSYSLPVVCTPVGGVPDLVVDGNNGLFVETGNSESIAHQLLTLLGDPERARRIGDNAARTVQRECGLERTERELSSLYRDVESEWMVRRRGIRESAQSVIRTGF